MNESPQTPPAERPRVLSGMRPTGRLHLGNYMGALYNWVQLQNEGQYDCFFFIADLHALTTGYADTSAIRDNIHEIDARLPRRRPRSRPHRPLRQSHVPQHDQLNTLLGMITPLGWLERVPTYKDQQEQLEEKDLATFGFLGYPRPAVRRHPRLPAPLRPRRRRPGRPRRAHPRARPALQPALPRRVLLSPTPPPGSSTPSTPAPASSPATPPEQHLHPARAHRSRQTSKNSPTAACARSSPNPRSCSPRPQTPRPRRPQNVEVLRQHPHPRRARARDLAPSSRSWSPTPRASAATDPGNPEICPVGDLHKVFSTAEVQRRGLARLHHRRHRLHRVQAVARRWHRPADRAHPGASPRVEAEPDLVDAILDRAAAAPRPAPMQTLRQISDVMGLRNRIIRPLTQTRTRNSELMSSRT